MTRTQAKDFERNVLLDAVDAHKRGSKFDVDFIEHCRDQLSLVFEDLSK